MSDNEQNKEQQELSRYERKRLERDEKEQNRQRAIRARKIRSYLAWSLVPIVFFGLIGLWVRSANKKSAEVESNLHAETFASEGQEHVTEVSLDDYKTVPPTSGPHYAQQTNWGNHVESVPEGYQIHNLEHGGVIIHYKPDLDTSIVDKLKAIGERYNWSKIIVHPYPALDTNIALTAWTKLDKFGEYDEERILAFIEAFRNHGPENVPDNMQSVQLP
ncbi:MAG: DUF3105 domain-containing protein [bacterium]|nr:DUF3105 domain-containing protein [bacterium]